MEVPSKTVQKWQAVWHQICNMAYINSENTKTLSIPVEGYKELLEYKMKNYVNYEEILLDHTWQKFSLIKDENGDFLEAKVCPDLTEIYVPRILFETMGVFQWFQHSFPNCKILFWEDDM